MAASAKITEAKARKIYEKFVRHYKIMGHDVKSEPTTEQGMSPGREWYTGNPLLVRNLEDSGAFGIAWEEGPYEWTYEDWIFDLGNEVGVMVEPMNGWAVGFYPV